jgi:hypothetical protein
MPVPSSLEPRPVPFLGTLLLVGEAGTAFEGDVLGAASVAEFAVQDLVKETVDGHGVEFDVW